MNTTRLCPHCAKPLPADAPEGLCAACLLEQGLASHLHSPEAPTPSLEELAPLFPHLELLALIGRGGMGIVYKARQPQLDRLVALKILPRPTAQDPSFTERFTREARSLARLNHPNIVSVYDFGRTGEYYYFVMEFVDGVNLRQLFRQGRLSVAETLTNVARLCEALQFAHDEGIVHRDIKPENILLDQRGRVKIADFGLAKLVGARAGDATLTSTGMMMGTPSYMAPEQVEKPEAVDHRADIYSLGVVLYEMLTGELPLGRFEPPSHRVQVDVRLDEVVLRALEKRPERRYQKVREVQTDLESIDSLRTNVPPSPPAPKPANAASPSEVSWAPWLGLGLILASIGLLLLPWFRTEAVFADFPMDPNFIYADGTFELASHLWARQTAFGYDVWQSLLPSLVSLATGLVLIVRAPRLWLIQRIYVWALLLIPGLALLGGWVHLTNSPVTLLDLPTTLAKGAHPVLDAWAQAQGTVSAVAFVQQEVLTLPGVELRRISQAGATTGLGLGLGLLVSGLLGIMVQAFARTGLSSFGNPARAAISAEPSLSRYALGGAVCGALFFLCTPLFLVSTEVEHRMAPGAVQQGPPRREPDLRPGPPPPSRTRTKEIRTNPNILVLALLPLLLGPIGTTFCGLAAISEIRHGHGRWIGLPLALAEALLFPLLILDAVIWLGTLWLIPRLMITHPAASLAVMLLSIGIIVFLDIYLVRRAWLAARSRDEVSVT